MSRLEGERVILEDRVKLLGEQEEVSRRKGDQTAEKVDGVSAEEVAGYHEDLVSFYAAALNGEVEEEDVREKLREFYRRAQGFSAENIGEFVALLKEDGRIPWEVIDDEILGEIFGEVVPFELVKFLAGNRELEGWESLFQGAFVQCLKTDLSKAFKMYEEGVAAGRAEFRTTTIRSRVLIALARDYPDKMLALAQSEEFQADPDALMHLGGFVDDQLETSQEFLGFLIEIERALEKGGNAEFLATVRKDFIRESRQKVRNWSFDETKGFVMGGMNRDEMFEFFAWTRHMADLTEPEKWGEWLMEIEAEEWVEWAGDDASLQTHPLVSFVRNSARGDTSFGEEFLKTMPEGALRDEVMLEFAWRVVGRKPELVAGYLEKLPESKGRERLAEEIAHARE
ncbi:MAG: hypothetical protein Q7Q71_06430 [Verrucomicrobiota bacterium JB023]|nr:hypothetical protein [Verrucomicrobiota bacterium JB023]